MPSYHRDPDAPTPNVPRRVGVTALIEPRGEADPAPSDESRGMRFVSSDELAILRFWPAHLPIRDALLSDDGRVVVA